MTMRILLPILVGLVTAPAVGAQPSVLTPADGSGISIREVFIPMPDGVRLAADLYLPPGEGAADYVFLLDPWWNPASERSTERIATGSRRPVFAYRLIARDTVEERIEELKQRKRELADALLAPATGKSVSSLSALTAEDVERLLV